MVRGDRLFTRGATPRAVGAHPSTVKPIFIPVDGAVERFSRTGITQPASCPYGRGVTLRHPSASSTASIKKVKAEKQLSEIPLPDNSLLNQSSREVFIPTVSVEDSSMSLAAASADESESCIPPWLTIFLWIMSGSLLIMFNKVLLTTMDLKFPWFLTTFQLILATLLTQVLSATSNLLPAVTSGAITMELYVHKVLPLGVCFALALVLGNIAYGYITLAFIQMIKTITPVPLILFSYCIGLERLSILQLGIIATVGGGILLCSMGELRFSAIGFAVQIAATSADCMRMLLLDVLFKDFPIDSLSLLYFMAPTAALIVGTGYYFFEMHRFSMAVFTPTFTAVLFANGFLAFSLNVAVVFLVRNTSPVMLSFSGPVKDVIIILGSVFVFGAKVSIMQIFGFVIAMFGLNLYRRYRSNPTNLLTYTTHCFCNSTLIVEWPADSTIASSTSRRSRSLPKRGRSTQNTAKSNTGVATVAVLSISVDEGNGDNISCSASGSSADGSVSGDDVVRLDTIGATLWGRMRADSTRLEVNCSSELELRPFLGDVEAQLPSNSHSDIDNINSRS